tara:strand:- start:202 stop:381 length:180 start_codon:yes stop_codon:yes gene_type:complete
MKLQERLLTEFLARLVHAATVGELEPYSGLELGELAGAWADGWDERDSLRFDIGVEEPG